MVKKITKTSPTRPVCPTPNLLEAGRLAEGQRPVATPPTPLGHARPSEPAWSASQGSPGSSQKAPRGDCTSATPHRWPGAPPTWSARRGDYNKLRHARPSEPAWSASQGSPGSSQQTSLRQLFERHAPPPARSPAHLEPPEGVAGPEARPATRRRNEAMEAVCCTHWCKHHCSIVPSHSVIHKLSKMKCRQILSPHLIIY